MINFKLILCLIITFELLYWLIIRKGVYNILLTEAEQENEELKNSINETENILRANSTHNATE